MLYFFITLIFTSFPEYIITGLLCLGCCVYQYCPIVLECLKPTLYSRLIANTFAVFESFVLSDCFIYEV
jgi:hypothetical protein